MKLAELQQAVRAADPAAVLVTPRVMDRVLQRLHKRGPLFGQMPHRVSAVVERSALYRHVDPDELDLEPDRILPDMVLLLVRPSPNVLANLDRDTLLSSYWRRLYHAAVHRAYARLIREGKLTPTDVVARISQLGVSVFAEARTVLDQEHYLWPDADDVAIYVEFAAVFLELRYFASNLVPIYFPSIRDPERVAALLNRDFDTHALFAQTRLPGAPDPVVRTDTKSDESHDYYWRLMRASDRAERLGNTVRAAIIRTKAARVAPAAQTESTRDAARADLHRLTRRLQAALELTDAEVAEWDQDLPALLDKADQGTNPSEAALLFDLQKVGIDHEREIYSLDVIEWALSGGKRPIKRPLPAQRLVRITKHLRSAAARLTQARLSDEKRQHLARLMQTALSRTENRLRDLFRPVLNDALTGVGLQPSNVPERTAFLKMIEELLDRIIEVGFLTFSDLRDTLSRNQLKMPDLADPQQFVRGDPLLRLDRRLASALDGVYRPSEFYLRWLERCTAPAFGTAVGRWLTLFVLVPFGGALLLLDGLQMLLDYTVGYVWSSLPLFGPVHWLLRPPGGGATAQASNAAEAAASAVATLGQLLGTGMTGGPPGTTVAIHGDLPAIVPSIVRESLRPRVPLWHMLDLYICIGIILLGLVHSERLRHLASHAGLLLWHGVRGLLYDLPVWLFRHPLVQFLLGSWPFHLLVAFVVKPLVLCLLLRLLVPEAFSNWLGQASIFLAINFVINSRLGREVEDTSLQALIDFYDLLRAGLIPGLFRLVMALFKRIIDTTEYVLFSVDEWLRFRSGEGKLSMAVRAIGTVLWYPISSLTRFYLVVLIEPGYNPVKAPVSILAAKFMAPIYPALTAWSVDLLRPWLGVLAWPLCAVTVLHLCDVFGFLVWEMKENWGLYRANRQSELRSVRAGPRGETVRRLLQPGFHSGTIPKLYARLRHSEREALQTGNWRAARAQWRSLEEVQKSLRRLVERELVTLLKEGPAWKDVPLAVGQVELTPLRIRIELVHGGFPGAPASLEWEMHATWLVAAVQVPGWLAWVEEGHRQAVGAALAGLYKLAGIDLVREEVRANLPPAATEFDVAGRDLVVWARTEQAPAVLYDLETPKGPLVPRTVLGRPAVDWPPLDPSRVLYDRAVLTWQRWVARWEGDVDGKAPPPLFIPPMPLLPAGGSV